jgi:hypothetical protein
MKMIKTICLQYKVCELTTRIREIIIKINKSKNNFEKQPNQNGVLKGGQNDNVYTAAIMKLQAI